MEKIVKPLKEPGASRAMCLMTIICFAIMIVMFFIEGFKSVVTWISVAFELFWVVVLIVAIKRNYGTVTFDEKGVRFVLKYKIEMYYRWSEVVKVHRIRWESIFMGIFPFYFNLVRVYVNKDGVISVVNCYKHYILSFEIKLSKNEYKQVNEWFLNGKNQTEQLESTNVDQQ